LPRPCFEFSTGYPGSLMNKEYMVSVEVYTARLRKSKSMKA